MGVLRVGRWPVGKELRRPVVTTESAATTVANGAMGNIKNVR